MASTEIEVISKLVAAATPVLRIKEIGGKEWFRKPKDGRRGPWLSAKYDVIDEAVWRRRGSCIYFLRDDRNELLYVGISLNKLDDRWRTSPAYGPDDRAFQSEELFHSQCWPAICERAAAGGRHTYTVSVLAGSELVELLSSVDHPISSLSALTHDPEIVVTAMELWVCKYGYATLWNKTLTGGKNPRAKRAPYNREKEVSVLA